MSEQSTAARVTYKDLPDFPGYRVGDDGTVWSCRTTTRRHGQRGSVPAFGPRWRKLKPTRDAKGHVYVDLRRDGAYVRVFVHRLVLTAFVGPCPEGMEGCHGDGRPANNALTNLRWDTRSANHLDKRRHGTGPRGEGHPWSTLNEASVRAIRRLRAEEGVRTRDLAAQFNVSEATVNRVLARTVWAHVQ